MDIAASEHQKHPKEELVEKELDEVFESIYLWG